MSLERIKAFQKVAEYLSFTKAAAALHVSQTSLSHQLSLLQKEYRVTLYRRSGRGIELTPEGVEYWNKFTKILGDLESLKSFQTAVTSNVKKRLALGATLGPSGFVMPGLMAIFRTVRPEVELILRIQSSSEVQRLLSQGKVELAVVAKPVYSPGRVVEPYHSERKLAFACPDHPWARKKFITLQEFFSAPLVVKNINRGKSRGEETLTHLAGEYGKPNVIARCNSPEAVKSMVQKGMGIGILYEDMLREEIEIGRFKTINVQNLEMTQPTYIVYSKKTQLSDLAAEFLSLLHKYKNKEDLLAIAVANQVGLKNSRKIPELKRPTRKANGSVSQLTPG